MLVSDVELRMVSAGRFDYLVVGAGSAGAVLANRLSADPSVTVCLLEAGRADRNPLISIPLGLIWLAKDPNHNWLFSSSSQEALNNRTVSVPRGKVLGGSSAINGMIYIRGHREDYDAWARNGCTGWDYESLLPYFKRSESNTNPAMDRRYHGGDGPLSVSDLRDPNPADRDFIAAANSLQFRGCADFNADEPEGVGIYQVTQKDGRRHTTAAAFLTPVRDRKNLDIVTDVEVEQVRFSGRSATGVLCRQADGTTRIIEAGEIILSAGAIGSPDILLRSGVGPGEQISGFGGETLVDLPGVGQNLQDHVDVMVICRSSTATPYGLSVQAVPKLAAQGLRWIFGRRGMLSSNMVEAGGFVRSSPGETRPDLQFHFIPGLKSHRGRMFEYGHGVSLHTCVLRPESRGSVTRTAPEGAPVIDLGLLREEADMGRLVKGVKIAREILRQEPMARHGLSEIIPGAGVSEDDELRGYIRQYARTVYHPVGTCAMGSDDRAVTDPRLRVRGVEGLRVVDASVMPTIVSGNTNAPAIMIAEKAADMILEDRRTGRMAA